MMELSSKPINALVLGNGVQQVKGLVLKQLKVGKETS